MIEEKKPPGIFSLLDDTCNTAHGMEADKADEKFCQKMQETYSDHPHFVPRGRQFILKHYAGDVNYDSDGFTEKNKDVLYNTLIECMQTSDVAFIRNFFPEDTREDSKKRPTTAGFKIKVRFARGCLSKNKYHSSKSFLINFFPPPTSHFFLPPKTL